MFLQGYFDSGAPLAFNSFRASAAQRDRPNAFKGASGSRKQPGMIPEHSNQVRCFLTWVKARPQHRKLRALLFTNSVWVL